MALDIEHALICTIIRSRDIKPVIDARITDEFFTDELHLRAWRLIRDYYREYGTVPTAKAFRDDLPTYTLVAYEEPYDYLIDRVREQRRQMLATVMVSDINTRWADEDTTVDELLELIARSAQELHSQTGTLRDIDLDKTGDERLAHYIALESLENHLLGIPSGLPKLDEALAGWQPEQLIVLTGLAKGKKSTWAMRFALNARKLAGAVPLFVSFEMSNDEQQARYDAMNAQISHTRLTTGSLKDDEKRRLQKAIEDDKRGIPFILSADHDRTTTVSGLISKVQEYQPDILFIDGAYLMTDERGGRDERIQLTNISRDLKRAAQRLEIPVVITTQSLFSKYSQRKGLQLDSLGYTSAWSQDADAIIGVEDTEDSDIQVMRIVGGRNAPPLAIDVMADWSKGVFHQLGIHDDSKDDDEHSDI